VARPRARGEVRRAAAAAAARAMEQAERDNSVAWAIAAALTVESEKRKSSAPIQRAIWRKGEAPLHTPSCWYDACDALCAG